MKLKYLLPPILLTIGSTNTNAALIGYWNFETDFTDQTSNGNNGTAVGSAALDTTTPAAVGSGSLNLINTADDSYLDINAGSGMQVADNPAFTISIWVRSDTVQDDNRIFSEASTTTTTPLYNLGTGSVGNGTNQVDFFRRTDSGVTTNNHELSTAEPFGDDMWHHVALVDTAGQVSIYVDGVLDRTADYTDESLTTDTTTFGAIKRATTCCGFTGNLDDISIFDTALNFLQIRALQSGVSPTLIDASVDSDDDDLPDYYEILFNLDPNDDGTTDINNGPDGNNDSDSLTNLEEFNLLTNPSDEDSDNDGLNDDEEAPNMSDPNNPDSDDDGLTDGEERDAGSLSTTNDSDMDGLFDLFEVRNMLSPTDDGTTDVINGPMGDPDSDDLNNLAEQTAGTMVRNDDSDNDNLTDGREVNELMTNPLSRDTDGDTIDDDEEIVAGADGFITDPRLADTDRDLINDQEEIDNGSSPVDGDDPNPLTPINNTDVIHVWNFNETDGTTINDAAGDVTGNWNGAPANLTFTEGILGGAADLAGQTGNGNHFNLGELGIEGATEMTISVWFQVDGNFDSGGIQYTGIFMSRPDNWGIAIRDNDTNIEFRYANPSSSRGFTSPVDNATVRDGTIWHHAVMSVNTLTGDIIYLVDGVEMTGFNNLGAATISGMGWAIGNDGASGTSRDFDGRIDDLAIWSSALTTEEMQNIYINGLRGRPVTPPVLERILITDIEIDSEGRLILTWNSEPSVNYVIRSTSDLSLPFDQWTPVGGNQPSQGATTTLTTETGFINQVGLKGFFAVDVTN